MEAIDLYRKTESDFAPTDVWFCGKCLIYYENLEAPLESYQDDDETPPKFVYCTNEIPFRVDLGHAIESALDDHDDEAGDTVTITTMSGKSWDAIVTYIVSRAGGRRHSRDSRSLDRAKPKSSGPVASLVGGAKSSPFATIKPGTCEKCGHHYGANEGRRVYCVEDSGCREHHDHSGYHYYCGDTVGCGARRAQAHAEKKEAKAKIDTANADLESQTFGVECRKDESVLDEIPGAYKSIDEVMGNQSDLVPITQELEAVLCAKSG